MSSAAITEYICEDCGTLFRHDNPTTLESMREVHNQLCPVKRQKSAAAEAAKAAAAPKPAPAAAGPQAKPVAAPPPAMSAPSAPAAGGATTVSLSGTGTSYGKVEGPIDP
ncbi:MAG: hypothetical protein ACREBU_20950, partial [Nitrososphaera sp.]